jgi:uncharacterized protein
MSNNTIVHFEIYAQDMARAKAFYETVLAVKLERMQNSTAEAGMDIWCFPMDKATGLNSYGAGGMLIKMEGFSPGVGGTIVYFGCEDCAVQAARSAAHGGVLCKEKTSIGEHGFFALVQDTENNMIGFHSMK